jgi:hypothetical protein
VSGSLALSGGGTLIGNISSQFPNGTAAANIFTYTVTAVPLPPAAWLTLSGLSGFAGFARHRKRG